jgi:hypothetical protein
VAAQIVASRAELTSTELVSYIISCLSARVPIAIYIYMYTISCVSALVSL